MKLQSLALAAAVAAAGAGTLLSTPAYSQAKEQFFPVLATAPVPTRRMAYRLPMAMSTT